jgi:type III restriction enzyme
VPDFRLLPFQEDAVAALGDAALGWAQHASVVGPARYGATAIPFLGQLRAVTGAGKTPILAGVVAGLGDAVVLWTSKSSAVVEQTYRNLNGKYRSLLPASDIQILRDIPSQRAWQDLLETRSGLTIWLLTTASWNEAEAAAAGGSQDARLNLHRPQQDWSGDRSPWERLRTDLQRPLWIVSDESHNQTATQLDQLSALNPIGFLMASATPLQSELFLRWWDALGSDPDWKRLAEAGIVRVRTRDVVDAELLKNALEVIDFNSGTEESLDGTLESLRAVESAVGTENAPVTPRAIYVVERSNPPRGSGDLSRPLFIWQHLRNAGVPTDEIAIYTDTKELPEDAVRVNSLSGLHPQYRHIIFNQALQEGWDDPEAYVCYFDEETKSALRIRQLIGRILRQPSSQQYVSERLNTATIILNTPGEAYENVIEGLRAELRVYVPEDEVDFAPIKLKTRIDPLPPIPVKAKYKDALSLPRRFLRAPDMGQVKTRLESFGARPFADEHLRAPGQGRRDVVALGSGDSRREFIDVIRSARTRNWLFFRRRLLQANRNCTNAVDRDWYAGPAFDQLSCYGSQAQSELAELAADVVTYYEDRVEYAPEIDPKRLLWTLGEYRPRAGERIHFSHSAHPFYNSGDFVNADELFFAQTLDRIGQGVWVRNPPTSELGFSVPLPVKVERGSSQFFPDFLWWVGEECWALETTGRHLLNVKVRGKLLPVAQPHIVLVVRGSIDLERSSREATDGWTLVRARAAMPPLVDYRDELEPLLRSLSG